MNVFVVIWVGRDGEAEFHGAWSSREAAETAARSVAGLGSDWSRCGVTVIDATIDKAVAINL